MFGEGALALGGGLAFKSHKPRCLRIFYTISGSSINRMFHNAPPLYRVNIIERSLALHPLPRHGRDLRPARLPEKDLQRFPPAATKNGEHTTVIEKMSPSRIRNLYYLISKALNCYLRRMWIEVCRGMVRGTDLRTRVLDGIEGLSG